MTYSLTYPSLVLFDHGDWPRYLADVYAIFRRDLIDSRPTFRGRRLGLKRHPISDGKEGTFWHCISDGDNEADRLPDIRRCERIAWIRFLIENCDHPDVCCWVRVVGGKNRVLITPADFAYIVVLEDRGEFLLPWTAYTVIALHRQQKLKREFEAFERERKTKAGVAQI